MDNEKINIFIPTETADILEKDARAFEIFKQDGTTINMNRFLSQVLIGYYDVYTTTYNQMLSQISLLLEENGLNDSRQMSSVADQVIKKILFPDPPKKKGKHSKRISLKPTSSTMAILISIEHSLNGDSMSQYLCRLLTSYTLKPLNERERIVFRSTYDFLQKACSNRHPFSFTTIWNSSVIHEVLPYDIAVGEGELFNYLLCQELNPSTGIYEAYAYRINRIMHVQLSANTIPLTEEVHRHLDMMKQYGPQYPINDDEESCVRLTETGVQLFNRIYFGRPKVDRIEKKEDGVYYYFKGSKFQLYTYFRRFDQDHAVIQYPESLRQKMAEAYRSALDAYTS